MRISRRDFFKLSGSVLAGAVFPRWQPSPQLVAWVQWPQGVPLGRVTPKRIRLIARPHPDGQRLDYKYADEVVQVYRSVVGEGFYPHNHVWFETPEGYAYSAWVQPVRYDLNRPLPVISGEGTYVELSVPYSDARVEPNSEAPVVYRLYYGSTYQVNHRVAASDGSVWYRINDENGVSMFGQAEDFRPVTEADLSPLSLQVDDKSIVVRLKQQLLSAYEGKSEVFRTQISSGRTYFGDDGTTLGSLTPAGEHPLWSKRISRHMSGGTPENGYDLPGVPWVMYFAASGAALHGTYWHNDFGTPKSSGCINLRPQDAKWLFRWTLPNTPYIPGYITVQWPGGTRVKIEA